ncbi:Asp23/Gls24 family envelope stress response protein [Nocardia sp. NPDC005978]|uniref:Asp23/Gls24 family envelope stress response protein n=1 Tax=unclassified Nocardia TaxID=2637762 RepID=UPI0033B4B7D9
MTVAVELPGSTTVSDRAVRRIAERAATEVDGVAAAVSVDALVTADTTALRVRLPVRYPLPVARVAESCRAHLVERVAELAGLRVTGVDIAVSAMVVESAAVESAAPEPRRRVL